jgi:alkanesulfonate monooxygenase SsuD/methylene tetrahydromethanopterin reductase-like flavin-dependent oxidoreductase (luciferase family)
VTIIGIHTNAQNKSLEDLVSIWRHADELGYGWISISDHFPGSLGPTSNEAVATHTAMAACTSRARCGVLVYSIGFRHPAVLASAAATIDHFSGGRAAIGLGAGSVPKDYELYGFSLLPLRDRMDQLEEGARCVAALLHDETVDFAGEHFQIRGASHRPRPVQERLPLWIGTTGERRGLRIAAEHADGWNCGFQTLEEFARKRAILHRHCETIGRDPTTILCSVNLIVAPGADRAALPAGGGASALVGSVDEVVADIERYAGAGADQVNFQLQYPWDHQALADLAGALGLR